MQPLAYTNAENKSTAALSDDRMGGDGWSYTARHAEDRNRKTIEQNNIQYYMDLRTFLDFRALWWPRPRLRTFWSRFVFFWNRGRRPL